MARKLPKILGYSAFYSIVFVFFLVTSFPVDRFTTAVEQQLSTKLGRTVTIESLSLSPLGTLHLENVEIEVPQPDAIQGTFEEDEGESGEGATTEAKKSPQPKLSYFIEEISVDVGFVSLLLGDIDFELSMDVFGGEVEFAYSGPKPVADKIALRPPSARTGRRLTRSGPGMEEEKAPDEAEAEDEEESSSALSMRFTMSEISLRQIHDLRASLPVPITGQLDMSLELESEDGQMSTADGKLEVALKDVVLSNKGYKADIGGMQMEVPPLAIASAELVMEFVKGEGVIKSFKVNSKHVDAKIEGTMNLGDRPDAMRFDVYVMFKVLDAYVAQSDALKTILPSLDSFSSKARRAHRPDGYYGFRFRGPWRSTTFQPSQTYTPHNKTGAAAREKGPRDRRPPSRPSSHRPSSPGGGVGEPEYGEDAAPMPSRPGRHEGAPPPSLTPPTPSRYEAPSKDDMPPGILSPPPMPEPEPVEEPQVEEAPVEAVPVEEAPVEEAPVEEAPAEDAPAEEAE